MKRILPYNGIEFCEIPRIEVNGCPISATTVRKLLENKKWDSIQQLVPQTTLSYLKERFDRE